MYLYVHVLIERPGSTFVSRTLNIYTKGAAPMTFKKSTSCFLCTKI